MTAFLCFQSHVQWTVMRNAMHECWLLDEFFALTLISWPRQLTDDYFICHSHEYWNFGMKKKKKNRKLHTQIDAMFVYTYVLTFHQYQQINQLLSYFTITISSFFQFWTIFYSFLFIYKWNVNVHINNSVWNCSYDIFSFRLKNNFD